ncbi:geranylgeranylglyceryl diphosphate synthase - conserved archaeal protein [Hyperthermus butylicus DSM 5456]|uniref:Geranylgeranylglyceryl phosphate synthase n=1 Tax=Hyperthermus butylicus (strain DSM 5456 / JCM 9403 / PLM1-5) TaxID=415426 RepID=GGGPS_HYPBU|nr:RecName: Full=Geranylgeranylglyceryl phosphate synthase; Short=GGGP synthase; Short=GGGPS; AltName: Full=(S)-3-O-geranylgeranylglyceryl phosphate synthase; AltName: Full=Phosphoglycerol geranylgeranyltransferase [Hyperthermus butylicus DSM 5456]ABM79884.1 geranylgeranylglyceryl diphosphate synthase - conserved archaeal protein [Hyperthermus butylicus DSM 5456]
MKLGKVERLLRSRVESGEKLFLLLSDPEKPISPNTVKLFEENGADVLLIGGSLNVTPYDIDEYIARLRVEGVKLPIVLFPGGLNNIAKSADAILFMTLMNSMDPYWIVGAQVAAAPIVYRLGLEAIPSAYIIVGHGGAAGHIGRALPIPYENGYIAAAYALAAEYLGARLVYFEAGSGAPKPVPVDAVAAASKVLSQALLVVGGGIREETLAAERLKAGADGVVIGTLAEKDPEKALRSSR